MSTFLSYSNNGTKLSGWRPIQVLPRGSNNWIPISNNDANTPAFLDDVRVIFQQGAYSEQDIHLETTDGQRFNCKASTLFAGGSRWVSQYEQTYNGIPRTVVLYDGLDRTIPGEVREVDSSGNPIKYWGAGKHSVGYDGTLVYSPRFHDDKAIIIEDINDRILTYESNIPVTYTSCINYEAVAVFSASNSNYVWFWNGSIWSRYKLAWPTYGGSIFKWGDRIYVTYASGQMERCIVHDITDPTRGYLLGQYNKSYNSCGWNNYVMWSENAGATIDSIHEVDLLQEDEIVFFPPIPINISDKYPRKMICCPYDQYSDYGNTDHFIGNAAFPWKGHFDKVPLGIPLIMAWDTYDARYENTTLYYYIHSHKLTDNDTQSQINFFRDKPIKPFVLYLDNRNWPEFLPSYLEPFANRMFLGIQVYPRQNESVSTFRTEMIKLFNRLKSYRIPFFPSLAFYNTIPIEQLINYFNVYDELLGSFDTVGFMPFSDMRPGGMNDNPILYEYLEKFYQAIPSRLNRYDAWHLDDSSLISKLKYQMPMFTREEQDRLIWLVKNYPTPE